MDNAAKFSITDDSPVDIEIFLKNERLHLTVTNRISEYQTGEFKRIADNLMTASPEELYIDKESGYKGSICDGIGLISIKKYYKIPIDFVFKSENGISTVAVTAEFVDLNKQELQH